ncbi:MAG: GHKL domain-containing protein [Sporomusaceae bacterium]|nr:GHKL domain-containing protein [Sporomusaceae bacterium]
MVKHLELNLNVRLMALQFLASDVGMKNLEKEGIRKELLRSVDILKFFNARVFDKDGKLVAEAWHSLYAKEVHDLDSFNQVLIGKQVISDVIVSEKTQRPYVSLRVPIYNDDGQIGAVLAGGILVDEIGKLIETEWLPADHYIFIRDNNNRIIYYPEFIKDFRQYDFIRDMNMNVGQNASGQVVDKSLEDEEDKLYIYNTLENSNWQIVMVVPLNQVYKASLQQSGYHFATFCLILLCAGLILRNWWQAKHFEENIQRLRLERLISVNQLAAGLAHEVRNPLTAIKGFIQLMCRKADQIPNQSHLEILLTEIDGIDRLLSEFQLLTLPLKTPNFIKVNIEQIISDVTILMSVQAVKENITLTFCNKANVFPPGYVNTLDGVFVHKQYRVLGDKARLKQVLINLLKNAIDAVGQNGVIVVELSIQENMAVITVSDNGIGMSADVLGKIGTPFFTTKEEGNGLGLSVCYNIIESHGGRITAESEKEKGTVFSIILPCVE